MDFEIINANILDVTADAVVLPANSALKEGSGVSTVIFEAAGRRKLTKACQEIGSCEVGIAVPTLAFNYDARFIIHAVVPKWIDGEHGEYDLLSSAYLSAMNAADKMECESIAFPLLASGNNGFDPELAFEIAVSSIESFQGEILKKVLLVIYGRNTALMVKNLAYDYETLPEGIKKLKKKILNEEIRKIREAKAKAAAEKMLIEQINKAVDYLKDEENRKKLLDDGFDIAQRIINLKKIV